MTSKWSDWGTPTEDALAVPEVSPVLGGDLSDVGSPLPGRGIIPRVGVTGRPDGVTPNGDHPDYGRFGFGGHLKNLSGQVTAGATAQMLEEAQSDRRYLLIQNLDATEVLGVQFGGAEPKTVGAAGQILLNPAPAAGQAGGELEFDGSFCPTDRIWIIATTAGHVFTAYAR